jgi:hypothetical protein
MLNSPTKPGGILINVSCVFPVDLRKEIFRKIKLDVDSRRSVAKIWMLGVLLLKKLKVMIIACYEDFFMMIDCIVLSEYLS